MRRALPPGRGMMYPDELREQLSRIQATQDELLRNQQRLEISMTQLQNSVPLRAEIQALLDLRVLQSVYRVESDATKERVDDLETRLDALPGTTWNRASIMVTAIVSLGALVISIINLVR